MAEFINYIIDSPIQPVKTNVLWVKKGVLHYYNKKWIPIAGGGSGNITSPIIDGEGNYSAVLAYSDNKALNISSIALGYNNISRNFAEASFGKYNLSHESDDPSIATLFSVGNGSEEERKNAFEVKEDGEIYIGKRTESLQSILSTLENHPSHTKCDTLEKKLEDLESYLKALKNHIDISDSELESTFEKYKTDVDGVLIEMSTSITQTAEEIRLEAEKTKKELDGKLTEYEASFSITAEEIRAEVSRVETDVNGKIVEANSLISQTADAIRTEVSRVELDINGKITEANSRIEQTANSITSEVYEIEKILDGRIKENKSSIEQTSEKIESTVEALTILDNKVLNQESKINQTAESIELLVTKVETQDSKIEENTANIEINKNAITSKVEKDDFDALSSAVEETGKEFTEVKQTVSGIETTIQDQTGKVTRLEETVTGLAVKTGTLEADIESLKKQSDGTIDTHFGTEAPTLNNEPAVNWDTEELKKEHTGDLYYNNATGEAFRWSYDPETETYLWIELTDSALTDALEKISKLEVAIDGKVTIFYNEPSNYKEGDIWFVHNDNYSEFKFVKGQLLTAINANTIFSGEDWEDKTNFASHAEVETAANNLDTYIRGAFLDQTLTVAEVAQIKESKKTFDSLIAEVEESYKYLIVSAVATESDKTKLEQAYNKLLSEETANEGSYILLVQAVNNLLTLDKEEGDDIINLDEAETLLKAYEDAYNTFLTDLKAYYDATNALTENVQAHLNEASKYIENIVSDGILSPIEKKQLFDIWRQIKEEFIANRGIAVNYKIIKLNEEGNYVKNEELYNDKDYFDIYEAYLNNYLPLEGIFIGSDWGFNDLNVASPTPEGYNTEYIATSFNNYYNALTPFAEMVAEITIAITDAHDKAIALANKLQEHLDPKDEISVIGKGVILSSIIGVKKSDDDTFVSAINAQALDNEEISTVDETHGRVVYAGGIPSSNNWNDSTTVIYEDGHVKFKSGEISDAVSIGETRQAILDNANALKEALGVGGSTIIDGGLVLSTLLGVVDTEGNLKSVLNASDISKDTVTNHGRIVFAGGIQNPEDWTTAKTLIYEDGYVHFRWGEIEDGVEIGNALVTAVSSGKIDLFSYPETVNGVTTLVPLFQVTKDETGKIIAVHSVYDFYANKDLTTLGETSSGGIGEYNPVAGTVTGIVINSDPYYPNEAGIIDLTDAFEEIESGGIDVTQLETYLTSNNYINSVNGITSMLGYTPANNASLANYLPLSGGTISGALTVAGDVLIGTTTSSYGKLQVDGGAKITFTNQTFGTYSSALGLHVHRSEMDSNNAATAGILVTAGNNKGGAFSAGPTGVIISYYDGSVFSSQKLAIHPSGNVSVGVLSDMGYSLGIDSGRSRDTLAINSTSSSGPLFRLNQKSVTRANLGVAPSSNYGAWYTYIDGSVSLLLGTNGKAYIANEIDMFSDKKEILNTGNYSDHALPLSGGTMTGTIVLPNNKYIDSQDGASMLGITTGFGCVVGVSQHPLRLRSDGTATINDYTLIHSGNIGSQSVASAYIFSKHGGTSTKASSWNPKTTWTKVWGQSFVDSNISSDTGDMVYYVRPSEYASGQTELCCIIDGDFYAGAGGTGPYKVWHAGNFNPADYLPKSGGTINGTTTSPLKINTTATDENGINFLMSGASKAWVGYSQSAGAYIYETSSSQYLCVKNGTPYYGTASSLKTIIHSGNIRSQYVAGLIKSDGNAYVSYNATYGYVNVNGVAIGLNSNTIERVTSGKLYIQKNVTEATIINQYGGNVGIGTDSPVFKLDVNGTARISGAVTMSNTLSVAGDAIVNGEVASGGTSGSGGGGGFVSALLNSWSEYNADTMGGYALSAALGYDLYTNKLDKSGGTITSINTYGITIDASANSSGILLQSGGSNVGILIGGDTWGTAIINPVINYAALGIKSDGTPYFRDKYSTDYTLIHSGNIGSQYVEGIGTIYADQSINFGAEGKVRLIKGTASTSTSLGFPNRYTSGLSVLSNYCGWQMLTYGGASINNPYFRKLNDNATWSDWKQLAFLTDNVASATKLQTARSIWGQSFDGTGNVGGSLLMGYNSIFFGDNSNNYFIGWGGGNMFSYNNWYGHYFSSNGAERMRITAGGNVLIGAAEDYGYKLQVDGSSFSSTHRTEELRLGETLVGSSSAQNKWYYASIGYEYEDASPQTLKPAIVFKTMYNTYAEGTGVERMRITSIGNVLVGTTEELRSGTKLQVSGYAFATRAWLLSGDYGMWRGSTYSGSLVETDLAYNATKHVFGGGNVLIGTITDDNSGAKLQVNGLISASSSGTGARHIFVGNTNGYASLYVNSSGNRGLYDATNGKWMLYTDGTNMLMPNGNIGIGTTDPSCKLDIVGNAKITSSTRYALEINSSIDNAIITFKGTNGTEKGQFGRGEGLYGFNYEAYRNNSNGITAFGIDDNANFFFGTGGNPSVTNSKVVVLASGNVGIGTNSPVYKLDVNGTFNCNAFETSSYGECFWGGTSANYGTLTWSSAGSASVRATSGNQLKLGVGTADYVTISANGAVTMSSTLSVAGATTINGALTAGATTINGNLIVKGDVASA